MTPDIVERSTRDKRLQGMQSNNAKPLRVLVLDTETETRNHYIIISIIDALRRQPEVADVVNGTLLDAMRLFRDRRCNTFLAIGSAASHSSLLRRLCALADQSALWTTEDPYELKSNVANCGDFNLVFTNDSRSVEAYGPRAQHLPLAASRRFQDFSVMAADSEYRYDLSFIGTAWPNRVADLREILSAIPRGLVGKIGLSYNPFIPAARLDEPRLLTNWRTSNRELARIANRSRVTIGLGRRFSGTPDGQAEGSTPPPRLFETALAGGFQIFLTTESEVGQYFVDGSEISLCASISDAAERVEWALSNSRERMHMARMARERALSEHLYDHRVRRIISGLLERMVIARSLFTTPNSRTPRERRVLVVTHNILGAKPGGGVEIYQTELPRIGGAYRFYFLHPIQLGDSVAYSIEEPNGHRVDYRLPHSITPFHLEDKAWEGNFLKILLEYQIDLVHFQHLLGYPLSLPLISSASGTPSIMTIHDYFMVCHRYNLLDYRGIFCDIANKSGLTCDICLNASEQAPAGSQTRRRNFLAQVLSRIDLIIANTEYSRDYLLRMYPEISAERLEIVEMLLPGATKSQRPEASQHSELRIVVPGNFTDVKGGHQLVRLFNALRDDPMRFTILGEVRAPFGAILETLKLPNVTVRGGYDQEEIFLLMQEHDISLHLSIWPETYGITLSEARASGVVPIVSDLGAFGERVIDGVDGFKVDPYDIGRTMELLRWLAGDREALAAVRAKASVRRPISPAVHLQQLRKIYDRLIEASPISHFPGRHDKYEVSTIQIGIRTNDARWDSSQINWDESFEYPEEPGRAQRIMPARSSDRLPSEYLHLPVETARALDPIEFRVEIDALEVDYKPWPDRFKAVTATHSIWIDGWVFRRYCGPPGGVFIRVSNGSFTRVYATTQRARLDVAENQNDEAALHSGFVVTLPIYLLPSGLYSVDVLQIYAEVLFEASMFDSIRVIHGESMFVAPDSDRSGAAIVLDMATAGAKDDEKSSA